LRLIREKGMRAGVALNPATPLSIVEYVLPLVDQVLLMTVNPGFGGQRFLAEVVPKIANLRQLLDREDNRPDLEVDGGIGPETAAIAVAAGADVLVAGSAVFGAPDAAVAVRVLRTLAGRRQPDESDIVNKKD
jgi:ribulose-phosphate 3-epimerase